MGFNATSPAVPLHRFDLGLLTRHDVVPADVMKGTDDWITTLNVNLVGALQASRLALTHWLRMKRKGLIINTGSLSELLGHTDPTYVVSKAGMSAQVSTIKGMADLKGTPYGRFEQVRAVTIAVGFVYTNIW
jgi:NAD(P)-dependent dehydrogenase (short-subunit alcohol dehydrogenase family)